MKVDLTDMTDRERVVVTKSQIMDLFDTCCLSIEGRGPGGLFSAGIEWPRVIEVEDVLGE